MSGPSTTSQCNTCDQYTDRLCGVCKFCTECCWCIEPLNGTNNDQTYLPDKFDVGTPQLSEGVGMSSIDTCWTCGSSDIEAIEKVALAIQQRHDDGSDFNKQWTNHHGLDRCDCDELVEFIRGLDKTFWDGMNRSLEQAKGPDEPNLFIEESVNSFIEDAIYKQRVERDKRNYSKEGENNGTDIT